MTVFTSLEVSTQIAPGAPFKITGGPHYDADATLAVDESYQK